MWDRLLFLASFVFLAIQVLSLWLAVASAAVRIVLYRENLIDQGRSSEVTFMNLAVLNGVSMYASWVTVATLLNLGNVLVYQLANPVPNDSACIVILGMLTFLALVYIVLDVTYMERYTRYSLTPYVTVIWALSAIINKNWDVKNASSIFSAVLLGGISFALVIKVCITVVKTRSQMYQYRQMKLGMSRK